MRITLFNYEIHFFVREPLAPRTRELAASQSADLAQALRERKTLLDDVFAQADLEDAEQDPTTPSDDNTDLYPDLPSG